MPSPEITSPFSKNFAEVTPDDKVTEASGSYFIENILFAQVKVCSYFEGKKLPKK